MNWTGQEKFDCYCGRPAFVKVNGEGVPEMICFAHTRESGLWAPLPKVKPENWHCVENPTREEFKPHHEAGDTEHPLVLAYFAGRRRVREVMADGFVESHPNVEPFLAEMARLVVLNEAGQEESDEAEELRSHLDVLWDALDEEEQSFVRHFKRATPEWRPEEE